MTVGVVLSGAAVEVAAADRHPPRGGPVAGEDSVVEAAATSDGVLPPGGSLLPGESLSLGESITSPNGWYRLVLQHDGNLVLHAAASSNVLWESGTLGRGHRLVMERNGNLVLHRFPFIPRHLLWLSRIYLPPDATADGAQATGDQYWALWQSGTAGSSGAYLTVRDDGVATISHDDGRVLWHVGEPAPDVGLADTKHIVYGVDSQRMWLVEADGSLSDTYLVSGRAGTPGPGRYRVYSKSVQAWSFTPGITMEHMVRFAKSARGNAIGFHSIPVNSLGNPIQTEEELGQYRSAGCVRQRDDKAAQLYDWAPVGTPVVVVA